MANIIIRAAEMRDAASLAECGVEYGVRLLAAVLGQLGAALIPSRFPRWGGTGRNQASPHV